MNATLFIMNIVKTIALFILGIAISVATQWIGALLTVALRIPDPALTVLYSSIGIFIAIAVAVYCGWRKNWILASGLIIGIPFWWLFILVSMTVTGTWL